MKKLPVTLVLALSVLGCRRHRGSVGALTPRWYVHPADGRSLRVEGPYAIHGALRFTERAVAPGPWPATRIAVTARRGDTWLFASEDGSVYRAERFDAPLRVIAALPFPLIAAHTPGYHHVRGVHSLGTLFAVDVYRRAHAVAFDGRVYPLGLERVITGAFGAERLALAVTEPGVLRVSEDGGATFRAVRAPSGIPFRVHVVEGEVFVTTTGGVYRWQSGAMTSVIPPPSQEAWVSTTRAGRVLVNTFANQGFRLPPEPGRAFFERDGSVTGIADDTLVTIDPVRSRELRREPAPGSECRGYATSVGPRLVCRHDGQAMAVFAKGPSGWRIVRDEARSEPMGPVAFDETGNVWAVSAPCTQRPERDPQRLCVYMGDDARREFRAPFPVEVVAVHDGAVLAVDTSDPASQGPTRAMLFRGGEGEHLSLPASTAAARGLRFSRGKIMLWEPPSSSHPRLTLVVGEPSGRSFVWRTIEAPVGASRGVHGPGGIELAVGATAAQVWQSVGGGPFRRLPAPVLGAGETLAIAPTEPLRCLGSYCQLGEDLTVAYRPAPVALALARRSPPGSSPAPRLAEEQRRIVCQFGARSPALEMLEGIASTGYTVDTTLHMATEGGTLAVQWRGALSGNIRTPAILPARAGARAVVRAVPGARNPVALVEWCNEVGCDDLVVTPRGTITLPLGRPEPGVELFEGEDGRHLVRFDTTFDATRIATLVRFDPNGTERGRRDVVLAGDARDAHVGRYGNVEGLWVRDDEGMLRFYAIDEDLEGRPLTAARAPDRSTTFCASDETPRGILRMRARTARVTGDGWQMEEGTWHVEELLELTEAGFCIRAVGGGETRSEAPASGVGAQTAVRAFALRAVDTTTMAGSAWQGGERIALTCTQRDPPPEDVQQRGH